MFSARDAAMETSELALGSNSFVLEKVLQEVQEVESREHRPEPAAAADSTSDLKFQPGFVHLLKGRFALMSRKEDRAASSGLDLASEAPPRRGLTSARQLSRSSDQLDGSPRRVNGLVPHDELQDALGDPGGQRVRPPPPSIHLFARKADVPPKDRSRSAGSKIIIIEASGDQPSTPRKAPPAPKETKEQPPPSKEAWPTPNIVASTRTLFEVTAAARRPAPKPPTSPTKAPAAKASGDASLPRAPLLRQESAPVIPERAEAEPVKSVSEARRLFDRRPTSESSMRQAPSPGAGKNDAPNGTPSKATAATISTAKGTPSSVSSSRSITLSVNSTKSTPSVSPVRSTASLVSPVKSTAPKVSPLKPTAPSVSPTRSIAPTVSPVKSPAPKVSPERSSASPVSPVKSPAPKVSPERSSASPGSPVKSSATTQVKSTAAVPPERSTAKTTAPGRTVNGAACNDPASWQSWEDIPVPQRRTFVSEARRVEIPKEQLTASRAKSKSFFFTAAEAPAVEPPEVLDRTITYKVTTEEKRQKEPEPLNPRLAEQTFWDSYRKEDDDEEAGFQDPELMEEYKKLMAQAREDVDEEEEEEEPLPSTNIDDVLPDLEPPRPVAVTHSSQKAEERKKKKRKKQRLQFAEPDQLTTTHEYPSERAMIEQLGISPDFDLDSAGEMSLDDPSAIFGLDDADGEMNDGGRATNRLLGGSSGIGSGTLASYTSKYHGKDFAWGESQLGNGSGSGSVDADAGEAEEEPTEPDSLEEDPPKDFTWSSSASADLLF